MKTFIARVVLVTVLASVITIINGCTTRREPASTKPRADLCPLVTTLTDTNGWQLGEAKYRAQQVPGSVLVFAKGENPTPNYKNVLAKGLITVFPPELTLFSRAPSGTQPQVMTPFETCGRFDAKQRVDKVIVHDKNERHEVKVEQVPD